jgi:RNA polymerase sigma-70 factor (ECF subfamily)
VCRNDIATHHSDGGVRSSDSQSGSYDKNVFEPKTSIGVIQMNISMLSGNQGSHGSSKTMNDELLVLAAQSGDPDAFDELRRRHSRKVLRTLYRITRNWEDAEDALQNAFLKVFLHLNAFEGRSSFSSWFTRIAINSALMIMRKKRHLEVSIDGTDDDSGASERWELPDLREDPEVCYMQKEMKDLLKSAIVRLRPASRDVVELQQARGYSTKELAQALGISQAAAKSRLLRARIALRAYLQ